MDLSGGDLTQKIIAGEYAVRNKLDACFLEKVDKNAMAIELDAQRLKISRYVPLYTVYRGSGCAKNL